MWFYFRPSLLPAIMTSAPDGFYLTAGFSQCDPLYLHRWTRTLSLQSSGVYLYCPINNGAGSQLTSDTVMLVNSRTTHQKKRGRRVGHRSLQCVILKNGKVWEVQMWRNMRFLYSFQFWQVLQGFGRSSHYHKYTEGSPNQWHLQGVSD